MIRPPQRAGGRRSPRAARTRASVLISLAVLAALFSVGAGASPAAAQEDQPADIVISEATAASAVLPGTNTVEWFDLGADITGVEPGHSVTVMSGLSVDRTGKVASVDLLTGLIVIDTTPADWPGVAAGDLIAIAVGTSPGPPPEPDPILVTSVAMEGTGVTGFEVTWVDTVTDLSAVAPDQPVTVLDGVAASRTGTVSAIDTTIGQITIDTGTDDWTGITTGNSISIDVTPPPPPEPEPDPILVTSVAMEGTGVTGFEVTWVDTVTDLSAVAPDQPVTVLDGVAASRTGTVSAIDTTIGQITIDTGTDDWTGITTGNSISIDVTPPPPPEPATEVISVAMDGTYVVTNAVVWVDTETDLSLVAPDQPVTVLDGEAQGLTGTIATADLAQDQLVIDTGTDDWAALATGDSISIDLTPPPPPETEPEPPPAGPTSEELGTLGGSATFALARSDTGQVAGAALLTDDLAAHAFVWDSTNGLTGLGTLGGTDSIAVAIDPTGAIAGSAQVTDDAGWHAFFGDPVSGLTDLGTLGGTNSYASGFDELGRVVGVSQTVDDLVFRAFAWDPINGMVDIGEPEPTEVISFAMEGTGVGVENVLWVDSVTDLSLVVPGQAVTVLTGLAASRAGVVVTVSPGSGLVIDPGTDDWTGITTGDSIRIDLTPPPEPPPPEPPPPEPPTEVISVAVDNTVVNGFEVTWFDDGNADLSLVAPGQAVTVLTGLATDRTGVVTTVDTGTGQIIIDTTPADWTGITTGDSIRIDLGSGP